MNPNIINLRTVNIEKWLKGPNNVYVGRKSKWGNPFRLAVYKSREVVVDLFKKRILKDKRLKNSVVELKGKVLGCWCAPSCCHAEVLHHLAGNRPIYGGKENSATNMSVDFKSLSIDDKLNLLLTQMNKIDKIDETVSSIDGRLSKIEKDTKSLSDRLTNEVNKRVELGQKVTDTANTVGSIEESCSFLSDKYENLLKADEARKLEVNQNTTAISMLEAENVKLKKSIDDLRNEVTQNKIAHNKEQQYHRTSLNIKLCGVPTQEGEEESKDGPSNPVTREVIDLVCKTASITMKKDTIDVCHRLGRQGQGPIIIRFATKNARCDFVRQGIQKLKEIDSADLDFSKLKTRGTVPVRTAATTRSKSNDSSSHNLEEVATSPATHRNRIYLQEHLTKFSKDLLTDTRAALQNTHQYYGYVKNGEIRVKISEEDKYSVITCNADIQRELAKVAPPSD